VQALVRPHRNIDGAAALAASLAGNGAQEHRGREVREELAAAAAPTASVSRRRHHRLLLLVRAARALGLTFHERARCDVLAALDRVGRCPSLLLGAGVLREQVLGHPDVRVVEQRRRRALDLDAHGGDSGRDAVELVARIKLHDLDSVERLGVILFASAPERARDRELIADELGELGHLDLDERLGAERRRDALLYDCATGRLVGVLARRHRAVAQMVLVVALVERVVADGAAEDAADWAPAG